MEPTSDYYTIGCVVNYRKHRRDGRGRIFEAYGPTYEATVIKKGRWKGRDFGYVITYKTEYNTNTMFMWAYDQELSPLL